MTLRHKQALFCRPGQKMKSCGRQGRKDPQAAAEDAPEVFREKDDPEMGMFLAAELQKAGILSDIFIVCP